MSTCYCNISQAIRALWKATEYLNSRIPSTDDRTNRVFEGTSDDNYQEFVTIFDRGNTQRRMTSSGPHRKTRMDQATLRVSLWFHKACMTTSDGIAIMTKFHEVMHPFSADTALGHYFCFRQSSSLIQVEAYPGIESLQQTYSAKVYVPIITEA